MACLSFLPLALIVLLASAVAYLGGKGILEEKPNRCVMTYMYPNYVTIGMKSRPGVNGTYSWGDGEYKQVAEHVMSQSPFPGTDKYRLLLYFEGWNQQTPADVIGRLEGVPVLFIPGNGGSYRQVRSLAAVAERAFQEGPPPDSYYLEPFLTPLEAGGEGALANSSRYYASQASIFGSAGSGSGSSAGSGEARELLGQAWGKRRKYPNELDWFTVDTAGELSAMDGGIAWEQSRFVVDAIHRILDLYKEALDVRTDGKNRARAVRGGGPALPTGVILVGHSMGGLIARAAAVDSRITRGMVETIITLSSPHVSSPVASVPSSSALFSSVNAAWRRGYQGLLDPHTSGGSSPPLLGNVVVASIAGGTHDSHMRSGLTRLDDIVPPSRGVSVGTTGMPNAWLPVDHQAILWCNQIATQVVRAMMQLVDPRTGQAFSDPAIRHELLVTYLRSPLPQIMGWLPSSVPLSRPHAQSPPQQATTTAAAAGQGARSLLSHIRGATNRKLPARRLMQAGGEDSSGGSGDGGSDDGEAGKKTPTAASMLVRDALEAGQRRQVEQRQAAGRVQQVKARAKAGEWGMECPPGTSWIVEPQETDMFIEAPSVAILSMDGRRRWLDIQSMKAKGKDHFVMVTNFVPCSGLRIHLWPEKGSSSSAAAAGGGGGRGADASKPLEITLRLLQLVSSPPVPQPEPGKTAEMPGPTGMLLLTPPDMSGFRFMTISIAPKPGKGGGVPPPASMAAAQFYSTPQSAVSLDLQWLLSTARKPREMVMEEGHALMVNATLPASPATWPFSLNLTATSCGLPTNQKTANVASKCKLRCFPPVAVLWDPYSGHEVVTPGMYNQTIVSDGAPAVWGAKRVRLNGRSDSSTLILLLDPHCGYRAELRLSLVATAGNYLQVHALQVACFAVAVVLHALAVQSRAFTDGEPIPSLLASISLALWPPAPLLHALVPLVAFQAWTLLGGDGVPPPLGALLLSLLTSYVVAAGSVVALAWLTSAAFWFSAGTSFALRRRRSNATPRDVPKPRTSRLLAYVPPALQRLGGGSDVVLGVGGMALLLLFHPALALLLGLAYSAWATNSTLCRYKASIATSLRFRGGSGSGGGGADGRAQNGGGAGEAEQQKRAVTTSLDLLDNYHHQAAMLVLNVLATALLLPSLLAWLQRPVSQRSWPSLRDAAPSFSLLFYMYLSFRHYSSDEALPLSASSAPSLYLPSAFQVLPQGIPKESPLAKMRFPLAALLSVSNMFTLGGHLSFLMGFYLLPSYAFIVASTVASVVAGCVMQEKKKGRRNVGYRRHEHHH